jgi:uncharacterized cupin superfamily protein
MEPRPGLFVSSTSTDDWTTDPELPGSQMHELVHADGVWSGMTRYTDVDGPVTWTPDHREVALILEGAVRIETADGGALDLDVGDLFSLAPGVETTWHIRTPFKELWVLASD